MGQSLDANHYLAGDPSLEADGPQPHATDAGCASGHGGCPSEPLQALRTQHEAVFHDTTLAHLLVSQGRLTLAQLDAALAIQTQTDAPLGQVLVSAGLCSPKAIEDMGLQQRRRNPSLGELSGSTPRALNVTEIIVDQELDGILREEGACTCEECRANALALALNTLPPRYISDHHLLLLFVERFRAESLDLIRERTRLAVRRVREKPNSARHTALPRRHTLRPSASRL